MEKSSFFIAILKKLLFLIVYFTAVFNLSAQVPPPTQDILFMEENVNKSFRKRRQKELSTKKKELQKRRSKDLPLDIDAGNISFDQQTKELVVNDGVSVGYSTGIVQSNEARINLESKDVSLSSNVRLSDLYADISASQAQLNLDTVKGSLEDIELFLPDGSYVIEATRALKTGERSFEMEDTNLTTCRCEDEDCFPWKVYADESKMITNSYGEVWDATLELYGMPVFYTPYLIFPIVTDRQTGFLVPSVGANSRTGFFYRQPFFWAIDPSSDLTATAVFDSGVRNGFDLEYREVFSGNHALEWGGLYFDESQRKGDLLGTVTDDIYDPQLKEERFGGYLLYDLGGGGDDVSYRFLIDGRYVADNLMPREYQVDNIAQASNRFLTSNASFSLALPRNFNFEVNSEYNQSIVENQDFVYQRYPEVSLSNRSTFRPFKNPFGIKFINEFSLSSINFQRQKGTDGWRHEFYEKVTMPFYLGRYFDASISGDLRGSLYDLDDTRSRDSFDEDGNELEGEGSIFESTSNRLVPGLSGDIRTTFEKVFDQSSSGTLKSFVDLGSNSDKWDLKKTKHTVEPFLKYRYVPSVDQAQNPQFDSYDRLAARNVMTYGVSQRLFARFDKISNLPLELTDIAPEVDDIEPGILGGAIDPEFGFGVQNLPAATKRRSRSKPSKIKEIANFSISQSLDIDRVRDDQNEEDAFSDMDLDFGVFFSEYFKFGGSANIDVEDNFDFNSWALRSQFVDDRGDELRVSYRSIGDSLKQLELAGRIELSERLMFGLYSRYDSIVSDFIDNRFGIRIKSDCDCWVFDIEVADRINPDQTVVEGRLTLLGLGELGNTLTRN